MLSQILALIIAIVLFSALLQGKYPRYLLTLAAGGAMVLVVLLGTMGSPAAALEALSVDSFVKPQFWFAHGGVNEFNVGINWSTILFLAGMMIMVEAMSEAGFFDWVCLRLAKALGFRPMPLMLSFMVLAALLSMFVDSITVVLFLVVATARLAHFLRFDPVPMIIGEIFAANLGGAATMSGDPPNIIIGTSLGLSFWDFLRNNGVICLIGLVLVLVCGAELFTGNSLMVCALKSKKITLVQMLRAWLVVWLGNFVGALFIVFLVYMAGIYKLNGEAVANSMVSVAAGKVTVDWVTIFFRGILCNIFVCLAVWIGTAGKTVVDKVVGILLPIAAFVACGFEHCVANMYFLPMGAVMHACGYGADVAGADALNAAGIAFNLSAATLGNIVGGAVLVALGYWFIYAKKSEA